MTGTMKSPLRLPMATRYSLLSRLRDWGDEKSWRDFFDSYGPLVYQIALKSGLNEAEAADVVQETVLAVAKNIDKFKRDPEAGSFKGWLRNLVRWRIGDQLRQRGVPAPTDPLENRDAGPVAEPSWEPSRLEESWEKEWQDNLLNAAVTRVKLEVKEEHFQIFDLVVLQRVPVPQVVKRLGVNRATVYLIKHRVSRSIKKHIQELENNPI